MCRERKTIPLPKATRPVLLDSHRLEADPSHRPPKSKYRSFQSSFSSRIEGFSGLLRPLVMVSRGMMSWRHPTTYIYLTDSYNEVSKIFSKRGKTTYPIKSIVFIIKPSVGLTVLTSSFIIFFTMVVLPALSSPLEGYQHQIHQKRVYTYSIRIRISLSFNRAFLNIESILLAGLSEKCLFSCRR